MQNTITMPANERLAWQIVLMHGVNLFNYKMIDSLVVSKNHDAILQNTAECRKQFFMQGYPHFKEVKDLEWNDYGTACAKVQWGKRLSCTLYQMPRETFCYQNKALMLERRYLLDDNRGQHAIFSNFYDYLPHQPRVFFCSEKRYTSFHGYGGIRIDDDEKSGDIMEYCMFSIASIEYGCFTHINGQQIPLMTFLEFPVLLKAFLNSTVIMFDCNDDKIYVLEGVEIPKNYQKWKQYFSTPHYKSFKDLPKVIRKAIVGRYKPHYELRKKIIC